MKENTEFLGQEVPFTTHATQTRPDRLGFFIRLAAAMPTARIHCYRRLPVPRLTVLARCSALASVLLTAATATVCAQDFGESIRYEVRTLTIRGNDVLSTGEIEAQMKTRETPGFLGKFFRGISSGLGRPDEHFDEDVFAKDMDRVRTFCQNEGFWHVAIDTSLAFADADSAVDITVTITEGPRATIRTLDYRGIINVPDFVFDDMADNPLVAVGKPYQRFLLEAELERLITVFVNAGYYDAKLLFDSSQVTNAVPDNACDVLFVFDLGKRYLWGPTTIVNDTSGGRQVIDEDVIRQQLDYKTGDFYSRISYTSSVSNLNRLGIFDRAEISVSFPPQEDTSIHAPSTVRTRPREKHELAPELILSDENRNFNIGTGLSYTNRNFFGGGRVFSTRLRFLTATIGEFPDYFGTDTSSIATADITFDLVQPYIFTNNIKGTWSLSYINEKQTLSRLQVFRNKFSIINRYATYSTYFIDWTLEQIRYQINDGVSDTTGRVSPKEFALLQSYAANPIFNSILSFTIQRDKSNDPFSPTDGFIHSATIDESGLLGEAFRNALHSFTFTQFYRVTLVGRWYFDMTRNRFSIFALKLKAGLEEKYGGSRSDTTRNIPPTYTFYAGGGGSIRSWGPRMLSAGGTPEAGGNLLFEGSTEVRTNIFKGLKNDLLDKIWIVTFVDFGNVWPEVRNLQARDVAIGAGIGFRYDTIFGPFRLDYGFRVYDPGKPPGSQWVTDRKFFKETLFTPDAYLSFGIGHAF